MFPGNGDSSGDPHPGPFCSWNPHAAKTPPCHVTWVEVWRGPPESPLGASRTVSGAARAAGTAGQWEQGAWGGLRHEPLSLPAAGPSWASMTRPACVGSSPVPTKPPSHPTVPPHSLSGLVSPPCRRHPSRLAPRSLRTDAVAGAAPLTPSGFAFPDSSWATCAGPG